MSPAMIAWPGFVQDENGRMSIAGFGSLLSITSARSTFPDLRNFRMRKVRAAASDGNAKA